MYPSTFRDTEPEASTKCYKISFKMTGTLGTVLIVPIFLWDIELWQFTNDSLYALYIHKVYVSGRNHRFVHSNFVISGVMVSTVFWSSL